MSKAFIEEHHNGVRTAHVAANNKTRVEEESRHHFRLILSKSPDRKDVSVFISKTGPLGFKESTMIINKEEALKTIYALKEFLNISDEDIQTFEQPLTIERLEKEYHETYEEES